MKPTKLGLLTASLLVLAGTARAQTFTGADLGTPTLPGSATKNTDGTITIVGGGSDIWGTVDGGYYYYASVSGQAWDAVVRVRNLVGPDNWTKCELMVRQDDGSGSPFPQAGGAFIADMTTRSGGQNEVADQYRANNNGSANWAENSPVTRPTYPNTWLRIRRAGSLFRIQYGTDGTNWTTYIDIDTATRGTADFNGTPWPDPIYVGIAVTAHNNGDATGGIATISDLSVTPVAAPTSLGVAQQVQSTTVYNGTEASFSMLVTNSLSYPVSYQWYKNGQFVTNATSSSGKYTFLATPADNGAQVYCKATVVPFSASTVTSATGTVSVLTGSLTYTNGLKEEIFLGATRGQVEGGAVGRANSVNLLSSFEGAINDGINNYTRRVSGYFIPAVTTNYVFFVASDDDSDLFLSTDSDPAHKRLIAQEENWSNSRQWQSSGGGSTLAQKRSDQWSPDLGVTTPYASGILLNAGQLYYIEGVQHQGGGGDNFAATFTYNFTGNTNPADGDAPLLQATNHNIAVITSPTTNLVWVTQPVNATNYDGQTAVLTSRASSDSEFQLLYQWYKNGSPVTNATGASYGFLTSLADNNSQWYVVAQTAEGGLSITSSVVTLTVKAAIFEQGWATMDYWPNQGSVGGVEGGTAGNPAFTMAVPAFEAGVNNENGDNYVNRVSGYFVPPATANYTFFVNSDDNSDLFLSTDDTVANKRLIAQETGWSNPWQWVSVGSGTVSQKRSDQWSPDAGTTVPYANGIAMTAGKKYYMEAVHHEGGGGDNVEVNYIKVGDADPVNGTDTALKGSVIGLKVPPISYVAFTQQPASVTTTSAYTATFTAVGTSDSPLPQGTTGQFYNGKYLTFPNVMYQWYSNSLAVAGATSASYTTPLTLPSNNGDQYVCSIRALGWPTWSNSQPAILTVITDTNPPTLVYGATYTNINLQPPVQFIDVTFNKRMDVTTLGQMANYTIAGATVTGVTINSNDYRSVELTFSGTPTSPVSVSVSGVKSFSGVAVAPSSSIAVQKVPLISQDIGLPDSTTGAPDPGLPTLMYVEGAGAYTITAEGSDIWNAADGFNFTYEMKTNDFDVVVRQKYITHTSNWAKGGLMARETLDPASRDWNIVNDPLSSDGINAPDGSGGGASAVECNRRSSTNGTSAGWAQAGATPDYPNAWVRLKRTGQVLTAYNSTNGVTWTLLATEDPRNVGDSNALPAAVYVGICVTAHNNDPLGTLNPLYYNTAVFADYNSSFVPAVPAPTLQASVSGGNLSISWSPAGGHLESSLKVGPGASWTTVGASNPATVPLSGAGKYFRVVVP